MRNWFTPAIVVGILAGPLMSSCFYSPSGTNASNVLYPSPDTGGHIQLQYFPPRSDVAKATFGVQDHDDITIPPDDTPDDGFTADIDVSKLTPGIYTVNVTLDEDTDPTGHMTLLVPGVASGDGSASGTASPDAGTSDASASS